MVSKPRIQIYPNKELREKLLQNFQTDDVKEIQNIIMEFLQNPNQSNLSLKDQLLLERINKLKTQTPLQTKKLELQNKILQQRVDFGIHFEKPLSNSGSQILKSETEKKYGFSKSENYHENIQLKKNFFINKIKDGEYCGVCKVCQNFTTAICITSTEAEGDIELHLESVHNKELFER